MKKICFLTPMRNDSITFITSSSTKTYKFNLVQNSYSYLYPYLKNSCDFITRDFDSINFKEIDDKYDTIYFPVFFSSDLKCIPKTRNFIFGGPGIDFLYFYFKKKLNFNFSLDNLSSKILGFDSSNFGIYFPVESPMLASLPLNDYTCYKSLKYGPCSFCSITPKFIETFRKIRNINRKLFDVFSSLKKFDCEDYKNLYLHISDSCVISKEIFEYLVNFRDVNFYVNTIFLKNLGNIPVCKYNNVIINISFESFSKQDLFFMNKTYFSTEDSIKILQNLQRKGYILKTNLIINNRNDLLYDKIYVNEYIKNLKNVLDKFKYIRFYLYPALRSFKFENILNKNLQKHREKFVDFTKRVIYEIVESENIVALYETDRNYWSF